MGQPARVTIVVSDDGADDQQLDDLARRLRTELLDLDVTIGGAPAGSAPPGTRAVELAAIGTLVVTLSQSPVLAAVINAISAWLTQRRQGTVRLELDGETLELSGLPSPEQRRLTDAWLRRHELRDSGLVGGRYALIVANYDYQDPGLRRLRAPAHDAERLARVLSDPAIGGFDVRTVINETGPVVNEAVEDFFADRASDDLLLFYFSGHGVKDPDGELFLAAASTKLHRLGATAVAADFVNRRMSRSQSRRIVLLLDCCYAGAFGRGMVARAGGGIAIEDQFGGRGRAVITASSAMEYAFEGQQLAETNVGGPSVFTSALVAGLETGDADRDQDGYVGLDELYDYVYDQVRRSTPHQTPGKWTFDVQGDLHLARRSRPVTTPARLPSELQEAIEHPLSGVRLGAVTELERLVRGRHAGMALAARLALERLTDDDSRSVSAAAATILGDASPSIPAAEIAAPTPPTAPAEISGGAEISSGPEGPATQPAQQARPRVPQPRAAAEPPEPPERPAATGAHRRIIRQAPARGLATLGAALLVVGFGMRLGEPEVLTPWSDLLGSATPWLWALVCGALVFAFAREGRERGIAQGAAFGLAAGILGLLSGATTNRSLQIIIEDGFYIAAAGAVLVLAAVVLEVLPRPGGRLPTATVVSAALAIVALAVTVVVPDAVTVFLDNGDHSLWAVLLFVAWTLLALVAVTATALRWRTAPSRSTASLGVLSTALVVADICWTLVTYSDESHRIPYASLLVVVVLVVALVGDDRPLLLAAARLSLLAMLLLRVPIGGSARPTTSVGHFLLEVTAAALAAGALYTALRPAAAPPPQPDAQQ
ncbi:caspase family protein [Plantactinospora solaniradicis]|uniref:Caspase family protein n=1 Tax=Plantactinospora solaniradicis TaxID=1723736 RepID=A0ABW1K4E2_9ACTN